MAAAAPSPPAAMRPSALWGPAAALLLNALVWGISWWPLRWLEDQGLHPLWSTLAVHALAVAAVMLLRPRAIWPVLHQPALWVVVAAAGLTNAAFNWGVVAGDVVRVVLLFYLMPLWSTLLARVLLNERFTAAAWGRVALAFSGAAIVLSPPAGSGTWLPLPHALADWLGVLGGLTFALNNVMLRREAEQPQDSRALAMFLGGVVIAGPLAWLLAHQGHISPPTLSLSSSTQLALVGMAAIFLASNMALQYGAARLPAAATSVIMLTEVVFAAASALWLNGGTLSTPLIWGGSCILAAAALAAWEPMQPKG